ncbi:RNA polymerase sigma factor [Nonomuraea angiospora]|uniref:RNA polymerase sigma factor n=1 Tax=Nonomuraea angiospora TaxID=46172 RepID=UPI0029B9577B|nr:sigma factor [Nonomuraea angiospora]MDX3103845.1 sigma factor [Nonomuraea angiospora]
MSADLVRAAQGGDTMAMNDLLSELTPYLGRICWPIALDNGPDAVQEALISIFRNLGSLRDPPAFRGWARAIAVREAVRIARRQHHAVEIGGRACRADGLGRADGAPAAGGSSSSARHAAVAFASCGCGGNAWMTADPCITQDH